MTKTIFFEAASRKYAKIVSLRTPETARESVRKLARELNKARTRKKRIYIIRVANLAGNRAKVMSKNLRLSRRERDEAREIEQIYRKFVMKYRRYI